MLANKYGKETLLRLRENETFERRTVSFYRYVRLENVNTLRNDLYQVWTELGILGRTYLATEGINAQMTVPVPNWDAFVADLDSRVVFAKMPLKIALEEKGSAFLKLIVRVKPRILADGLDDNEIDMNRMGEHLTPVQFNEALAHPDAVVVDVRNHYEHEIGHFDNAIRPDVDTFQESLPIIRDTLADHKDKPVLMYCTGGIRCEKASAYLRANGFQDVSQLNGGIIAYAQHVKEAKIESKYRGKNFVFDDRKNEKITDDILSTCHLCDNPCDEHQNCQNHACHLLFLQCQTCAKRLNNCCSAECKRIAGLPLEEQRTLRREARQRAGDSHYVSQLNRKKRKANPGAEETKENSTTIELKTKEINSGTTELVSETNS